jgi:hypothetical protein
LPERIPEEAKNPFGRPIFQNLQYSNTPTQPLVPFRFTVSEADDIGRNYRILAMNTAGLKPQPTEPMNGDAGP